jgi:hypothetical protein
MDFKDYRHTIKDWALIFRNGLVDIPEEVEIHSDFLQELSKEEFDKTFRYLWYLFYQIYTDASKDMQFFRVLADNEEEKMTSGEAGIIFNHMKQLYLLFKFGKLHENGLSVETNHIKTSHKKIINAIIPTLTAYGFKFEGLADRKITQKILEFYIYYPDNPSVIKVLYLVAKKASNVDIFKNWNYRLLADEFGKYKYNDVYVSFYDSLHRDEDREFIRTFHESMLTHGYFIEHYPGRGGGHISYFKNSIKEPFYFDIRTYGGFGMYVCLRIRNAEKCLPYLNVCSELIKDLFRTSLQGCNNPNCKSTVRYIYENNEIQRCGGCCGTAFEIETCIDDIPHYIKLVELGVVK